MLNWEFEQERWLLTLAFPIEGSFWHISSSGLQPNSIQSTLYEYSLFSFLSVICLSHLNSFTLSLHLNYCLFSRPWEKQDKSSLSILLFVPVFPPARAKAKSLGPAVTLSSSPAMRDRRRVDGREEGRSMEQKSFCEASVAGRQATGCQRTCNLFFCWCILVVVSHCCRLLLTKLPTSVQYFVQRPRPSRNWGFNSSLNSIVKKSFRMYLPENCSFCRP